MHTDRQTDGQMYATISVVEYIMYQVYHVVHNLWTQHLNFVAAIPEQIETSTMHFPEVSGGIYHKLPEKKVGKLGQINGFFKLYVMAMGKNQPKFMFFNPPFMVNREKNLAQFFLPATFNVFLESSHKCIVVVYLFWHSKVL